ncbi:MAG: ABC transporter ATP-binding protein [Candidatus Hydrogenedentes bacterium]|nr:ABC transporter ATP-binding protein [Candidatus Hydrogenedentota bacterium]
MSPDVVISARGLSKSYRLFGHPGDRVKQFLSFGLRRYHREFTALNGVSFDIRKGETVGIVGRNGAGKSTLLQLVCGIIKPTSGSILTRGRIAALLELGAGFNPEFTGRENVHFQGAIMGLDRLVMEARFDAIAEFADIGEFIDQPVRTYSSGMFVRLAFAVAISAQPDILVVDEALAVGDFAFRSKCYDRIRQLTDAGTTLLFVSHDLQVIKAVCARALYLDQGLMRGDASAGVISDRYFSDGITVDGRVFLSRDRIDRAQHASRLAEITDVSLTHEGNGAAAVPFQMGDEVIRAVRYKVLQDLDSLTVAFHVRDDRHQEIMGSNTRVEGSDIPKPRAGDTGLVEFSFRNYFRAGEYGIAVGLVTDRDGQRLRLDWNDKAMVFSSHADRIWSLVRFPVAVRSEKC